MCGCGYIAAIFGAAIMYIINQTILEIHKAQQNFNVKANAQYGI